MPKKITIKEFKERAKKIHKDRYNYDKTVYTGTNTKVIITCREHGDFKQTPHSHLKGHGCPKCANQKKVIKQTSNMEEFKEKAKKIHGDKYNYDKTVYVNANIKVIITCPEHGDFKQTPNHHLSGDGCPECGRLKISRELTSNTEEFKEKAREIHKNKYNYDKTVYVHSKEKVIITCPEHGDFEQTPNIHLKGSGCPKCGDQEAALKLASNTEEFIKKSKEKYKDSFGYTKTVYVNTKTKITITCKKHGDFITTPDSHLRGCGGCPVCNSSRMENEIRNLLIENKFNFEEQKPFPWLIGIGGGKQTLDFFLSDLGVGIECQGVQHFFAIGFFGGEKNLKYVQELDQNKLNLCKKHGIEILYYSNLSTPDSPYFYPYKVYEDLEELMNILIKMRAQNLSMNL